MSDSGRSESPCDVDFSVIRTAIDMGHSTIDQILHGVHYGSPEVRTLLYEECDYIVECKVCRNLFRSFPNFVAHKRVYCTETIEEKVQRERTLPTTSLSEEEAVIVEPEIPVDPVAASGKTSSTDSPVGGTSSSSLSQNTVIQQVVDRQFGGKSREYQFYTKVAEQLEQSKAGKTTNTVTMTAIPTSSQAVLVSYDKGDKSKSARSASAQNEHSVCSEQGGAKATNRANSSNPVIADAESCQSKSIASICKRLASNQEVDLGRSSGVNLDVAGRQTRRARKSLPRKSTEEKLPFSSELDGGNSTNVADADKSLVAAPKSVALLGAANKLLPGSKNSVTGNTDSEAMDVTEKLAPASPIKSSKNSNKDWMKFCDLKKNICKKCGTRFEQASVLKRHLKKTHGLKFGDVKCPKCGNMYESLGTMVRHMRINHKATPIQVERVLKVFEKQREVEKKQGQATASNSPASSSRSSPGTSTKSSPDEKVKGKASPQLNTSSALYKALTGNLKNQAQTGRDNLKDSKLDNTCSSKETGSAQVHTSQTQRTRSVDNVKQTSAPSGKAKPTSSPVSSNKQIDPGDKKDNASPHLKKASISNIKETKDAPTSQSPISVSQRPVTRMHRETKTASDSTDVPTDINNVTKVPKGSPEKDTSKDKKDVTPESDSKDASTRLKGEKALKVDVAQDKQEPRAHREERRFDVRNRRLSSAQSPDSDVKSASPTQKKLPTQHEDTASQNNAIQTSAVNKKYDTRTAATSRETQAKAVDKTASEENLERSVASAIDIDSDKIMTGTGKAKPERAKSESSGNKEDTTGKTTDIHKSLRSRSESADKVKEAEIPSRSRSRDNHRSSSLDTSKSDSKTLPEVSLTPLSSPVRTLPPGSCPTSPTPSLNSNSCDGYSSKFKMTVKEMAELVESTSLAKFASERKKKARRILTNTKVKSNKQIIPTRLAKPMKGRVRRRILPVKKVYSTRLSIEDPESGKSGPSKGSQGNLEQSRKLLREMRRLQNSAGLVESNIYSSSSPAVSAKKAYESDSSATDIVLKERNVAEKTGGGKGKSGDNEVKTSSDDLSKAKGRKETSKIRNTSRDRTGLDTEIAGAKAPAISASRSVLSLDASLRDKSEERSSRNSSAERPRGRIREKRADTVGTGDDLSKAKGRKETSKIRNTSRDRSGLEAPAISTPRSVLSLDASLRDKSEERSSRNSSAERPRGRIRERTADTVGTGDDSTKEKLDNLAVVVAASEDNDRVDDSVVGVSDESDSDAAKLADDKQMALLEKRRQKIELQITKTNSLRKKMLAAIKSVNNSKRIMQKKSPEQVEMKSETKTDDKLLNDKDEGVVKHPKNKETVGVKHLNDKDKATDAHNHRTRLATGSIFFNSELLKLSPSKLSNVEGSPRKLTDTKEQIAATARRKLSLSLRKNEKKHERTRSEPMVFSLATGVKKCELCGKVFWKLKTFRGHKCQKVSKKRVLSGSPSKPDHGESSRGGPQEQPGKKARVDESAGRGRKIGTVARVSLGRRIDKVTNVSVEKSSQRKISPSNSPKKNTDSPRKNTNSPRKNTDSLKKSTNSPKKNEDKPVENKVEQKVETDEVKEDETEALNKSSPETSMVSGDVLFKASIFSTSPTPTKSPTPGSSRCDIAKEDRSGNNSDDSDFSGFSESDLQHTTESVEEFEMSSDIEDYMDSSDEAMEMQELDNGVDESEMFGNVGPEGLVYKSGGKKTAKSGTVEEIWVERPTEERNENRQYVRDPNNPSKVYCQSNKDVDKIVDEKNLLCLKCNWKYASMSNLRRHAIRHLGWKRYKCKTCTFTCYDKSECRSHYRWHGNNLDMTRFLQYFVDLKKKGARKRHNKRVTTLRRKEMIASQDPYRKPRQTVVVKPHKGAPSSDPAEKSPQLVGTVVNTNNNPSQSDVKSDTNNSLPQSDIKSDTNSGPSQAEVKSNTGSKDDSALAKARMNLANALTH